MVLPFVEVSHLASSTSFYAAVLQPLGLRYLSTDREPLSSVGTVTYGLQFGQARALGLDVDGPLAVLQIREAAHPLEPPKRSSLVLTAPSRAAVADFHAAGLNANPWLRVQDGFGPGLRPRLGVDGGVSRATIADLDGNTMLLVYPPPPPPPLPASSASASASTRSTRSTRSPQPSPQVARIIDWHYDISSSSSVLSRSEPPPPQSQAMSRHQPLPSQPFSPPSHHHSSGSVVSTAMSHRAPGRRPEEAVAAYSQPSASPRQSSSTSGLNTTTVVGALLGIAAGAALTYGMVTREKGLKPHHEVEHPVLPRRSTYPEKLPSSQKVHHQDRRSVYAEYPPRTLTYPQLPDDGDDPRAVAYHPGGHPARQLPYQDNYPFEKLPFQDDYALHTLPFHDNGPHRKLHYQDDYPAKETFSEDDDSDSPDPREQQRRPVQYLTQRGHGGSTTSSNAKSVKSIKSMPRNAPRSVKSMPRSVPRSVPPSRDVDEAAYDTRSRHSSKHTSSRTPTMRSRSEVPTSRAPLMMADIDNRSHAPSRHSVAPKSTHSQTRSSRPRYDADRDSYFSARSRGTSATARPPPAPEVQHEVVTRSRAGSRITTTKVSMSGGRSLVVGRSKSPSYASARNVALPMSGVGSSHANWDDDMESIAPSDSISCVGSKTSRRSRRTP
ncbi:hypothetical protein G7046_g9165 [Stylonectria norvegica]|nr:hypothetical protein G7046_g9165 [Stylonectria norvegica]